jgi:hypothetical protein
VQGVVQRELGGKDGVVVGVDETEAFGDGFEPPRLGHRIEVGRDIGAVDDLRQPGQRRVTLELMSSTIELLRQRGFETDEEG